MKNKKFVAVLTVLIIILSAVGFTSPVYAAEITQKGSLTIVTEYNRAALAGMNIEIFRIASAVREDNGEIKYVVAAQFADLLRDTVLDPYMNAGTNLNLARIIRNYAARNAITGTTAMTDSSGKAYFSDLPAGMYLVAQNNASSAGNNGVYNIQSFIIPVPYPVKDDGFLNYIAIANPKIEVVPTTTHPPPTTTNPPMTTNPPGTTQPPPTTTRTTTTTVITTQPPLPPPEPTTTQPSTEPTIGPTEPVTTPPTTEPPIEPTIGPTEPPLEEIEGPTIPLVNITFPPEEEIEEPTIPLASLPPKENPKTGDNEILFALLGLGVACGGIVMLVVRKKNQKRLK